jgi:hypothetical protein
MVRAVAHADVVEKSRYSSWSGRKSFEPKIFSHAMVWKERDGVRNLSARLTSFYGEQEVQEILKKTAEEDEVRECTFRPIINGRSEKMMTKRTTLLKVRKSYYEVCWEPQHNAQASIMPVLKRPRRK